MPIVYPCVRGHEIVGRVASVGSAVTKFKGGDLVGVGCPVDSCGTCAECKEGLGGKASPASRASRRCSVCVTKGPRAVLPPALAIIAKRRSLGP